MKMSNQTYDTIKFISSIILPFAAMVVAIMAAFGLTSQGEVILAVASAIEAFMGILLSQLSKAYFADISIKEDNAE